jgi:hypothetical protein
MEKPKSNLLLPILTAIVILVITSACAALGLGLPEVENHPQPTLAVTLEAFQEAGCPPNEYGFETCPTESPLGRLGCEQLRDPGDMIGGLEPQLPIKICLVYGRGAERLPVGEYLYNEGCSMPMYVRYAIQRDGQLQVLKSEQDMQAVFAPIESEDEALSYAIAVTGLGVRYGLEARRGLRYLTDKLEDTYVTATPDGYLVHLFDYRLCGCGPHTTYSVDVLVSREGQVQELSREPAYEDPEEDGLCVD